MIPTVTTRKITKNIQMYRKGKKGIRMVYYKTHTHTQLQKIGSNREIEEQNKRIYIRQMTEVNLSSIII